MTNNPFSTPILFLIFNRPETTARVFQQIRAIKPKFLYVSADGPRPHRVGEVERCQHARDVVLKNIDWDCEVHTRFLDANLGCKMAVSSAITWFFEHVNEGIILEDDCLPDLSFFSFCQTLLEYYRNDHRIMHIGGTNFQDGRIRGDGSYYFSHLAHIWGWATWKRAWSLYDVSLSRFPSVKNDEIFLSNFPTKRIARFWLRNFELVYTNQRDTWDYQWQFTLFFHKGLSIIPNVNLVTNIGFSEFATHTHDSFHDMANRPLFHLNEIVHPTSIVINTEADIYTIKKYLQPPKSKKALIILKRFYHGFKAKQHR